MNENQLSPPGALRAVRDPATPAVVSAAEHQSPVPAVTLQQEPREVILREVANLEGELASLNLRLCRLHPDMDVCGEPLC